MDMFLLQMGEKWNLLLYLCLSLTRFLFMLCFESKQCNAFKTRAIQVKEGLEGAVPGVNVTLNPEKVMLFTPNEYIYS